MQRTGTQEALAQALAPSTSQEDFEIYCAKLLAEDADRAERLRELANSTSAMAARTKQRCEATARLLSQCFSVTGVSSYSPVAGLSRGVK